MGILGKPLVERRALYYPWVVPPVWWVKQAMLMNDSIATLGDLEYGLTLTDPDDAIHGCAQWLRSNELWVPIVEVEWVSPSGIECTIKIRSVLVPDGTPFPKVVASGASYWATHISESSHDVRLKIEPQTSELDLYGVYEEEMGVDRWIGRELVLDGVMPIPADSVPLQAIVDFRAKYRDELLAFRGELDALVERIRRSPNPVEAAREGRESIELAVTRLQAAARSQRVRLLSSAAVISVASATVHSSLAPSTREWVFGGLGTALGVAVVERMTRPANRGRDPHRYLIRAHGDLSADPKAPENP